MYKQLPMCRADEQPKIDHSKISFDGSKPAFYKPSEKCKDKSRKVVVAVYHERLFQEQLTKPIEERQLTLMSPAGGITSGDVAPHNLYAFFRYQQSSKWNPITKDWWNLVLMKKLNEDDEEMHSTFDYKVFEHNYYDYTKQWARDRYEGYLPIASFTNLERVIRSDCVTAEGFAERVESSRKSSKSSRRSSTIRDR